jgi:peptide/nickel transport system permease protein
MAIELLNWPEGLALHDQERKAHPDPPDGLRPRHSRTRPRSLLTKLSCLILLVIVLAGLVGPMLLAYDPFQMDTAHKLLPPSAVHLLGTDHFGRDIFTRILYGSRTTLFVGAVSTLFSVTLGLILGIVAGYCGGVLDSLIMRAMDVMLSFPLVLLAIIIIAVLGPGLGNVIIAVGVSQIPLFARLSRSLALSVKQQEFLEAAVGLGARDSRILRLHVLPNIVTPIVVQATTTVAFAILSATSLNFLGLGIQPPSPDWGSMVNDFRRFIFDRPELPFYPGLALLVTVLCLNLLGDGLMELVDPTAR